MNYSPTKVLEELKKYSFIFKKGYGQNFIIDENTINNIVNNTNIDKDTLVIEIGPGAGALTYKLALCAKQVLAYEIDIKLKDILAENLKGLDNVKIIYEDFLKCNVKKDLECFDYDKIYVVANLPYYITTPIIMKIIDDKIDVSKVIIMVQKEVGNRFKAKPGAKDYSSLSIFLNYYYDIKKMMDVSRNIFIPKPNVDSVVLEMNKINGKYNIKNEELFFSLVRNSFKQKRKTIKNNLKDYDIKTIEKILNKYKFDLNSRAEQIPMEVFVDISNNL